MQFELEVWGDGVVHLVHWDSLHGRDVVLALDESGVLASYYDDNWEYRENESVPDVVAFLCRLMEKKND